MAAPRALGSREGEKRENKVEKADVVQHGQLWKNDEARKKILCISSTHFLLLKTKMKVEKTSLS